MRDNSSPPGKEPEQAAEADRLVATAGPKARNVVLEKSCGSPQTVNDGVTIAKEMK